MRLPAKKKPHLALLSLFLAYALIMGLVERWIPFTFAVPGVKLGLANVVVLTALYLFPPLDVLKIVVLKCVMTALIAGTGLSFIYSLSGALVSFVAMTLVGKIGGERIGPVGVSVIGAIAHNMGQMAAACAVMKTVLIAAYLPVLMVSGVVTGLLVGIAVKLSLSPLKRYYERTDANTKRQ